jgi:hypothetical protein
MGGYGGWGVRPGSTRPSIHLTFPLSHYLSGTQILRDPNNETERAAGLNFGTYFDAGRRAARIGDTACLGENPATECHLIRVGRAAQGALTSAPRPAPGRFFLAPRAPRPSYDGALIFGAPRPGRPGAPANPAFDVRFVWFCSVLFAQETLDGCLKRRNQYSSAAARQL